MHHRITTYKELEKWSKAYVDGSFGLFFLIGSPGHAKSFTIRKLVQDAQAKAKKKQLADMAKAKKLKFNSKTALAKPDPNFQKLPDNHVPEPLWIEGGAVSAFKLYQELYTHLNEMVVMDDVDSVYSDRNLVRLLKALCQTEEVKTVGWWTDNRKLEAEDIPTKFKTRSRACIIANHWKQLSEHVGSLMSRGIMVQFDPSIQEVFDHIKKNAIIKDKEILDFVQKHLWMINKIDIRDFINAVDAKKAKLDWQEALSQSLGIRDMLLVDKFERDKSFVTVEQRVSEFMRRTSQSRPMWFKAAAELKEVRAARDGSTRVREKVSGVMA